MVLPLAGSRRLRRGEHEGPALGLGGLGERHVDGHLVAVEVGVEGLADEGMQLDGLALDEDGLEGLDAEAVQGRRAVQQDRDARVTTSSRTAKTSGVSCSTSILAFLML